MNIFRQLVKSLYSPRDIATFRFQGIGKTILFVFLLMFISIIPNAIYFTSIAKNGIDAVQQTVKKELPEFTLKNGTLTSDQKEPIRVQKGDFTVIFDSTGETTPQDLKNQYATLGILKNGLVFSDGGNIQNSSYTSFGDISIKNHDVVSFMDSVDSFLYIVGPILLILFYLFVSAVGFIKISILAFGGLFFANVLKRKLVYRQSWRITAYSITLPTIFFMIMDALHTQTPGGFMLDWMVTLLILFLAIKEMPQPKSLKKQL
jgi:maltodextrin utilization protein YvdJ